MLRRDPTNIHLVAEDFKDIGRGIDFSEALHNDQTSFDTNYEYNADADNQNWDGSLDKSYLASRSRGRDNIDECDIDREVQFDRQGGKNFNNSTNNHNATNIDNVSTHDNPPNSHNISAADITANNNLLESLEDADVDQGNMSYIPKSKGRGASSHPAN